jgi:heptaprenyl diphosphate synthase
MKTGKLLRMALLTAVALIIFAVEAQIPVPVAVPGVKLGLANVVTLYAIFTMGAGPAAMILFCRIFLGAVFSGQMMMILYSVAGGILCWCVMCLLKKVMNEKQIWICSIFGAIAHNIGQIVVAVLVTRTLALAAYLPVLMVSGIITGLFTGLVAQFLMGRLRKLGIA